MSFSLDSLQRWIGAHTRGRWLVMLALAFGVLLGTTPGAHEDIQDATTELTEVVMDYEPAVKARFGAKSVKPPIDHHGGAGDKPDQPQGVFARPLPLQLAHADSEQPHAPVWRRPALPKPEQLLRPPDA
jgi:hypothetical protein